MPTVFTSPAPAMPATTVQKITGATIIRTSLMNASPSGFIATPEAGHTAPTTTPIAVAMSTWP